MITTDNIGAIVFARVESSRLPGKCLERINGREAIRILLDHVKRIRLPIVMAIPATDSNDVLARIADEECVLCYRGEDDSPLHRAAEVCRLYGWDHFVRVTHDDIIIDPLVARKQAQFHVSGGQDYTYCSKILEGAGVDVYKAAAVVEYAVAHQEPSEYLGYFLKSSRKYVSKDFYPPYEYQSSYRCTMDYHEDLQLLRIIFGSLHDPGTLDILNFLDKHQFLLAINRLPQVTIHVECHNYGKYVVDALDSIVNQAYTDWELLVYDDGSTDDSAMKILEWYSGLTPEHRSRTKLHRNTLARGLTACCNDALKEAKGRYIIRLDADDRLDAYALRDMVKAISDMDVSAVLTGFYLMDADGMTTGECRENEYHPACALMLKSCAATIKYRDGLSYFDGLDFWKRFLEVFDIGFLSEPRWFYRQHPESKTAGNSEERKRIKEAILHG